MSGGCALPVGNRLGRWEPRALALFAVIGTIATPAVAEAPAGVASYVTEGDAIAQPLNGRAGDAARGKALIADRQKSLCVLCHTGPFADPHFKGTLGPDLSGIGGRLSPAQIRLRIVDMKALNAASIMPSYYRVSDAPRVAGMWRGRTVLPADDIEDIVAYLSTLKD